MLEKKLLENTLLLNESLKINVDSKEILSNLWKEVMNFIREKIQLVVDKFINLLIKIRVKVKKSLTFEYDIRSVMVELVDCIRIISKMSEKIFTKETDIDSGIAKIERIINRAEKREMPSKDLDKILTNLKTMKNDLTMLSNKKYAIYITKNRIHKIKTATAKCFSFLGNIIKQVQSALLKNN